MNTVDWRGVLVLLFIVLMIVFRSPITNIVLLALGAGWFLQAGLAPLRAMGGSVLSGEKVTYWRGQRIVQHQPVRQRARSIGSTQLAVTALYLLLGGATAVAGVLYVLGYIAANT
jgi:hypothetical protein